MVCSVGVKSTLKIEKKVRLNKLPPSGRRGGKKKLGRTPNLLNVTRAVSAGLTRYPREAETRKKGGLGSEKKKKTYEERDHTGELQRSNGRKEKRAKEGLGPSQKSK